MHRESGIGVGGRVGVGEASTLVDSDVDEYAARLHTRHELITHEFRCLGARYQHRSDHHVRGDAGPVDLERVGGDGLDPPGVERIELSQALEIRVEYRHLGTEPDRDRQCIRAGNAAAEHDDPGRMRAGNSGYEEAGAAIGLQHRVRADERGEATGDFTHRCEQRQRAGG